MQQTAPNPIEITCSRDFLDWLAEEQISLAFTTYQTNRLFLLGRKENGELSTFERLFDRPMGLFAQADRLYMGSRYQIWQMDNTLPPGVSHDGYDALYVPRRSYTTGDVDIHDVGVDGEGRLLFVSTLYSCLATVSERYSFRPIWQPPFISQLAPEDRCHLNGLAMAEGQPRYATAVSRSDVFSGWRKRREAGGVLIDIQDNTILLDNLSMPHSPRLHEEKLWLLNAGSGDLGYVDRAAGRFEAVAFCPGFARGLAFHKHYAIVGLSKPRRVKAFEGLSLDERLAAKESDAICGLAVIDTRTGNVAHWIEAEGILSEIYDVAVLPGVVRPMALGFKSDEISRFVAIDYPAAKPVFQELKFVAIDYPTARPVFQELKGEPDSPVQPLDFQEMQQGSRREPTPPTPAALPATALSAAPYRYQIAFDMGVNGALQGYERLTFPPLREQLRTRVLREPLVAVVARLGDEPTAMALAEISPDNQGGRVLSCFVAPSHRRRGVGLQMLASLAKGLAGRGLSYLDLPYATDWPSAPVVEHILGKYGWMPPRTTRYQYKANLADLAQADWLSDEQTGLPPGYATFAWGELTPRERDEIGAKGAAGWYPPSLDPFQFPDHLAPNSLGLRDQAGIVGWMVTHRAGPDTIQYTSLFVAPELRGQKVALALLAASLHSHLTSSIPYAIWQVESDNQAMLAFVKRYLQPYLAKQSEQRLARRLLG